MFGLNALNFTVWVTWAGVIVWLFVVLLTLNTGFAFCR